jgi:hypothetical protein
MSVPGMQIAHLSSEQIKKEIASLQKELRKVEDDFSALRHYLHGLSLTLGEEYFSAEALRLIHPKRANVRGLRWITATAQQRRRRYQKPSPYVHRFDTSPEEAFRFTNPVKRGNAACPTKRVNITMERAANHP